MNQITAVTYARDAEGIATLTIDDPNQSANTMNELFSSSMAGAVAELAADVEANPGEVKGVVIVSAKKTFFAGGDLKRMMPVRAEHAADIFAEIEGIKATLRRLELLPIPVVAAINGAALGGGLELALAANYRVAAEGRYEIGLPEATLGLLPGGGGITRTVRMFGLLTALTEIVAEGKRFKPEAALANRLIDEIVPAAELVARARSWVLANAGVEGAGLNPWDKPGYKMPGGLPTSPALAGFLPALAPILRKQIKQSDMKAPKAILSAAVEGALVDFDTASRIESRYFTKLVTGQQAKNMIQAFFFDLGSINSGALRPAGVAQFKPTKAVVLGAGMMGAGIAYVLARAGVEVVLKDVSRESAERGKAYTEGLNAKAVSRGRLSEASAAEILGRITATDVAADVAGADLVVEAVFEDVALKQQVFNEILPHLAPGALLCSNTSTLPITELAAGIDGGTAAAERFIGLHFFSPVDKMPLVEIIRGGQTSDETLAQAYDVVQLIKKTPMIANDSRGFYTSRVIGTVVDEGLRMIAEGVQPYSVERSATQAGYPVGPLQLADELNLELVVKIAGVTRAAAGIAEPTYSEKVASKLIAAGRTGKLGGAGFYNYVDGKRDGLWEGLADLFPTSDEQPPIVDLRERQTFIEALETAKTFEEGVVTSAAHANIGSIFGIGFPPATGGAAQFITGYDAADGRWGIEAFIERAEELAAAYGDRFTPSAYLRGLAASGDGFPA